VVGEGASVQIRNILSGRVVRTFGTRDPVYGAVYSQKFDKMAVMTRSGPIDTIKIFSFQASRDEPIEHKIRQKLSCFAFSHATGELVCGSEARGLRLFGIQWGQHCEGFEYPEPATFLSCLPSGTVVANFASSGIQLLSLNGRSAPSQAPPVSALTVHALDHGKIVAVLPTSRYRIALLESATMSTLFAIHGLGTLPIPADRISVLCASLEYRLAVCCVEEMGEECLKLWKFDEESPRWTVGVRGSPQVGVVSPTGSSLVGFYIVDNQTYVYVWDASDGRLQAQLLVDSWRDVQSPEVEFTSEHRFRSHHGTYSVGYTLVPQQGSVISVTCEGTESSLVHPSRQYDVDDSCEWVVSGSERILCIPPGYVRPAKFGYQFVGSTIFMVSQDGILRKLTFRP
jgi:hypothetical protein